MERKAHNSLKEAALQVQLNEGLNPQIWHDAVEVVKDIIRNPLKASRPKHPPRPWWIKKERILSDKEISKKNKKKIQKDHVEYDEVDSMVLEYFENYFGDNLNEDTSDEDIMDAVYDLVELTEAVLEAVMGGWNRPIPNPLKPHDSVGGMRKGYRSDTWTAGQSIEKDKQAGLASQRATQTKKPFLTKKESILKQQDQRVRDRLIRPQKTGGKHDSHWSNR